MYNYLMAKLVCSYFCTVGNAYAGLFNLNVDVWPSVQFVSF